MNMQKIEFQSALPNEEDARIAHAWRNDPLSREMSRNTDVIEWDHFYKGYIRRYFSIPSLPAQFIVCDGKRAGIIFFEPSEAGHKRGERSCEIAINIAPEFRGNKIAAQALEAIQPWVRRQGMDKIYAQIKVANQASIASFSHAGFSLQSHVDQLMLYAVTLREEIPSNVFVIAEAGSNWHTPSGDDSQAKRMIDAAVSAGCDAIKFQVFRPETTYVRNAGAADYLGTETEIWDMFKTLAMPYEWIPTLAAYCKQRHIEFMASPFSLQDFEAVNPYSNYVKIASYEITHTYLIDAAASSGKRTFMSTGGAQTREIDWAVDRYFEKGGEDLVLLQCTAHYPAHADAMQLKSIPFLRQRYQVPVGLSDHSRHSVNAPIAAVALGACVIEKHFTLDNTLPGPDHIFAVTPPELKQMVEAIRATESMLGSYGKWLDPSEQELRSFAQRRLQATRQISLGDLFIEGDNVAILRPGKQKPGVLPKYLTQIHGKRASRSIPAGDGIQMGDWI